MAHSVVISIAVDADAAAQFNVYRSTTALVAGTAASGTPLNASPLPAGAQNYTDNTVTAGQWFYGVEAIENGVSSGLSNVLSVSLPPAVPVITLVSAS